MKITSRDLCNSHQVGEIHPLPTHPELGWPVRHPHRSGHKSTDVLRRGDADRSGRAVRFMRDVGFHVASVQDIISLCADTRSATDIGGNHPTGCKAFVEDPAYENTVLHAAWLVLMETLQGASPPTIQSVLNGPKRRPTFEFRRCEPTDSHSKRGVDESELRRAADGRYHDVHTGQVELQAWSIRVVGHNYLPPSG